MENECEMCGRTDMTSTWHGLCWNCVGKLKAENKWLREGLEKLGYPLYYMKECFPNDEIKINSAQESTI